MSEEPRSDFIAEKKVFPSFLIQSVICSCFFRYEALAYGVFAEDFYFSIDGTSEQLRLRIMLVTANLVSLIIIRKPCKSSIVKTVGSSVEQ